MHKFPKLLPLVAALAFAGAAHAATGTAAGTSAAGTSSSSTGQAVTATPSTTGTGVPTATAGCSGTGGSTCAAGTTGIVQRGAIEPPSVTAGPRIPGVTTTSPNATNTGTSTSTSTATTNGTNVAGTTATNPATNSALLPSNQTSGLVASGQVASGAAAGVTNPGVATTGPLGIVGSAGTIGESAVPLETILGPNGDRIPVNTVAVAVPAPAAAATPTPELDAATRSAGQRLRAKTARKEQLMHSITPRTDNDKTDQMPDDPISPSLRAPAR